MSSGQQQTQKQTSTILRKGAHAFCTALLSPPAPPELLSTYFTSSPRITEHGPAWAQARLPFLGKTFKGREGCLEYFTLLGEVLEMQLPEDAIPGPEGFIVDAEAGMVSVVGKGHFKSRKTGKGWDEQFIYRLSDFDAEGRVGHWEIWADPLSAWDAVGA
ncbi:uncharacterized protein N0V89_011555 [Didymosphaeria variabile]|uniref:SnoaL-like domain-containing protein n=1 Tax=Didymosphaeria variabile TaxID=1932322 RepID=A0A9W8X9Z3_9PLEO|nr:uncharacterized protein N0V89_011555 [Didymosphaeria variabile]KAJ4345425.1 hypothetical protein N0V89_011555 [Didymosphaeria variabile]